jgi:hypothetical protein
VLPTQVRVLPSASTAGKIVKLIKEFALQKDMANQIYVLVKAPEEYPGKTYNGLARYCYEHHLVWWQHHRALPRKGFCIHHKDGDTHNNNIINLEEISWSNHGKLHPGKHPNKKKMILFECPICHITKEIYDRKYYNRLKHHKAVYCSRRCVMISSNKIRRENKLALVG